MASVEQSLGRAYDRCRDLHRRHGRSYYLATRLLPAWKRPHVHALYGFTRYADEIVDRMDGAAPAERAARLIEWGDRFQSGLRGERVDDPILPAVLHTIDLFRLDRGDFTMFLRSMAMDLTVTGYASYRNLLDYMAGSAAAIGTMMLPILGTRDAAAAREPARQLGLAFQLTNFIRDVREDLDRGRVYLPMADLALFGVTRQELREAAAARRATRRIRSLIRFEVGRARDHYRAAAPGLAMLESSSRACVRVAYRVYGGILDQVVALDYDVLASRAVVPRGRRLALAASCLVTPPGRPVRTPGGAAFRR